jgi:hypothetical protein
MEQTLPMNRKQNVDFFCARSSTCHCGRFVPTDKKLFIQRLLKYRRCIVHFELFDVIFLTFKAHCGCGHILVLNLRRIDSH